MEFWLLYLGLVALVLVTVFFNRRAKSTAAVSVSHESEVLVENAAADASTCTACAVVLTESQHTQHQELDINMCSREVTAHFTAGPKRKRFMLRLNNENTEGEDDALITMTYKDPDTHHSVTIFEIDNVNDDKQCRLEEDPSTFLTLAGLQHCKPALLSEKEAANLEDEEDRMKWVLGDVFQEAFELIVEKHGFGDNCGVSLGICTEDIYGLVGLDW